MLILGKNIFIKATCGFFVIDPFYIFIYLLRILSSFNKAGRICHCLEESLLWGYQQLNCPLFVNLL